MNDTEFLVLMDRLGADRRDLIHERALHRAGFESFDLIGYGELWEDPEDPVSGGGLYVGREEALRRVKVRVAQARAGWGPLIEQGQVFDPFDGGI